jgi:hypothetical protein
MFKNKINLGRIKPINSIEEVVNSGIYDEKSIQKILQHNLILPQSKEEKDIYAIVFNPEVPRKEYESLLTQSGLKHTTANYLLGTIEKNPTELMVLPRSFAALSPDTFFESTINPVSSVNPISALVVSYFVRDPKPFLSWVSSTKESYHDNWTFLVENI